MLIYKSLIRKLTIFLDYSYHHACSHARTGWISDIQENTISFAMRYSKPTAISGYLIVFALGGNVEIQLSPKDIVVVYTRFTI